MFQWLPRAQWMTQKYSRVLIFLNVEPWAGSRKGRQQSAFYGSRRKHSAKAEIPTGNLQGTEQCQVCLRLSSLKSWMACSLQRDLRHWKSHCNMLQQSLHRSPFLTAFVCLKANQERSGKSTNRTQDFCDFLKRLFRLLFTLMIIVSHLYK